MKFEDAPHSVDPASPEEVMASDPTEAHDRLLVEVQRVRDEIQNLQNEQVGTDEDLRPQVAKLEEQLNRLRIQLTEFEKVDPVEEDEE